MLTLRSISVAMVALLVSTASTAEEVRATFCERLAPKLNMKLVQTSKVRPGPRQWTVDTLGGLGPLLFGGTAATTIRVLPIEDATLEEYKRLEKMCSLVRKGAACPIEGPAVLHMTTRKAEVKEEIFAGERPVVEIRNTKIFCRDRP